MCIPKRHLQDKFGLNHDSTYADGNKRVDAGAALQQVDCDYGGGTDGLIQQIQCASKRLRNDNNSKNI